ncbi:nucleotidyltransferase domain-containing protein [Nonomuraea sp. PA05]|uniref:nucleotidyltransferase domain-containing protein n=1 Tax=Nonomuraea sp. PA05 TaxID=2604466 RepID=UPI0011DB212F|nr:nucleotidyltransferase domain-containing protein [Nonomuraea sp. PA05]TYB50947.1 nucleotidyltransferase domain-containing protein [Nonomuraea sp. PA05]
MELLGWLAEIPGEQPYPLQFATVSGAHLYGFPSVDSDVDLRGVHVLPLAEVAGLRQGPETLSRMWTRHGVEVDLVTHDVAKFCRLLLGRNGYVLEQLLSPLVVASSPAHEELVALAPGCLTRHHAHHYLGFARTQWRLFQKSGQLKPLLYTFRVLATGTHLMQTGKVQADLTQLYAYGPAYLPELIAAKQTAEHGRVPDGLSPIEGFEADVERMRRTLEEARDSSALPERATVEAELHDLVLRARSGG